MIAPIDKTFRRYGEDFFGKECMNQITDAQVEEARVWAFNELAELTEKYGRQPDGACKELFCNYIFGQFL